MTGSSAAPRLPSGPDGSFRCEAYACTLAGKFCAMRQTTVRDLAVRNGQIARRVLKQIPPHLAFCASGACEQGLEVLAVLKIDRPEIKQQPRKPCAWCGKVMVQAWREGSSNFNSKKTCSPECSGKIGKRTMLARKAAG